MGLFHVPTFRGGAVASPGGSPGYPGKGQVHNNHPSSLGYPRLIGGGPCLSSPPPLHRGCLVAIRVRAWWAFYLLFCFVLLFIPAGEVGVDCSCWSRAVETGPLSG